MSSFSTPQNHGREAEDKVPSGTGVGHRQRGTGPMAGFWWVLWSAGWRPGADTGVGSPLHWQELALLACFPVVVWGVDELFRFVGRARTRE